MRISDWSSDVCSSDLARRSSILIWVPVSSSSATKIRSTTLASWHRLRQAPNKELRKQKTPDAQQSDEAPEIEPVIDNAPRGEDCAGMIVGVPHHPPASSTEHP